MDQHEEKKSFSYASVEDAISAIRLNSPFSAYGPKLDWAAAKTAIVGAPDLPLNSSMFGELLTKLDRESGPDAIEINKALLKWGHSNWPLIKSGLQDKALEHFIFKYFHNLSLDRFYSFVEQWPRLKDDPEFLDRLIAKMRSERDALDFCVPRLRALKHDHAAAARILAVLMDASTTFRNRDQFASLLAEWAGDRTWGQLQHLLWRVDEENNIQPITTRNVERLADLLKEFGILCSGTSYQLLELSTETKAAWRRELRLTVGDDEDLRIATAEALLGLGAPANDRDVLFAVAELYRDDQEGAFAFFLYHSNALVRRRARAVIDLFHPEPDAMTLMRTRNSPLSEPSPHVLRGLTEARTWIGDARIEHLIEDALDAAAGEAGKEIENSLASGEETHVMLLFTALKTAFTSITTKLQEFAAETNADDRLSFQLDIPELDIQYRPVGKHEEGGPGVGSKRFSTDVCLLIEGRNAGKRFAYRASLLQAKRLTYPNNLARYPIDKEQLEDLSQQTLASFLLLLGPECEGVRIPIIPARLMLDLIERGEHSTQIAPVKASRLGKSLGTWLVEDAIGLWTGDWGNDIVTRAEGGERRRPLLLAKLVVDRIPKGKDGGPRDRIR